MQWFSKWLGAAQEKSGGGRRRERAVRGFESLETRAMMAADPLPVLMVIADQRDFYYREYGDTRQSLEQVGLAVRVAATTTARSLPHANTGEPAGTDGGVTPDLALAQVKPDDYSAIVFVGGWGASMYQYAFHDPNLDGVTDNFYDHAAYNGDDNLNDGLIAEPKRLVNQLIHDFLAADKPVGAICHGVTVLAWARVDGVSPLSGRQVVAPFIGSPAAYYGNTWYANYELGQREQVVANGGRVTDFSGQVGDPTTVTDDVVVDGRIITAENYDSALEFGRIVAKEVLASSSDPDTPLVEQAGNVLTVRGTSGDDVIMIRSAARSEQVSVTINGIGYGPYALAGGPVVRVFSGGGHDQIDAAQMRFVTHLHGEAGDDRIVGGSANDVLDGGDGHDRIWGGLGDDVIRGGAGNDSLFGSRGNDLILGGDGDDSLEGDRGRDLLIGGLGHDHVTGGADDDLLIGGTTSFDDDPVALLEIHRAWLAPTSYLRRVQELTRSDRRTRLVRGQTVHDDQAADSLVGGTGNDLLYAFPTDSARLDARQLRANV